MIRLIDEMHMLHSHTHSLSSSGDSGTISESVSGKSSPASFPDHPTIQNGHANHENVVVDQQNKTNLEKTTQSLINETFSSIINGTEINTNCHPMTNGVSNVIDTASELSHFEIIHCTLCTSSAVIN